MSTNEFKLRDDLMAVQSFDKLLFAETSRYAEAFQRMIFPPDPARVQKPTVVPSEPASDTDRPTLADRLDKAEARIQELKKDLERKDTLLIEARLACLDMAAESLKNLERAKRAETIALKVDLMGADLERCKAALGTIAFDKIVRGEPLG